MFTKSDSWGYSIADGVKDASRYNRLLGLQEFLVFRAASHSVKASLLNCQNVGRLHFDLYNILNEDVLVTLCLEEEHAGYKATHEVMPCFACLPLLANGSFDLCCFRGCTSQESS